MNRKKYIYGSVLLACMLAIFMVFTGCPDGETTGNTGDEYQVSIGTIECSTPGCTTCTVDTGSKGASKGKPVNVAAGTNVTVRIFASKGCMLTPGSLKYNDTVIASNNRFQMPARNVVITAKFEVSLDDGPDWDEWVALLNQWRAELQPIIDGMTPLQKYGQMTQGLMDEINESGQGNDPTYAVVPTHFLGSILAGGHNQPDSSFGAQPTPQAWRNFTNKIVEKSLEVTTYPQGISIPLIFGLDCMHGASKIYNATMLPHNIGLGAIAVGNEERGIEVARQAGELTSREMMEAGLRWTFGPVLGTAEDARWGRTYECYSEKVEINAIFGKYFTRGLHSAGVATCPKHFGPEGQTINGANGGNAEISVGEYKAYILSFEEAIKERTMSIMMTYGSRNGVRVHEDEELMMDLLKGEMGFPGMILTDWSSLSNVSGATYADKVANGINAGIDMVMAASKNWLSTISALDEKVKAGVISEERINDAVMRCLLFKKSIGHQSEDPLHNFWNNPKMEGPAGEIRTDENREIARGMVADSLVLLKDTGNVISNLKNANTVLVVGRGANSIGLQCGGWTIEWQGNVNLQTAGVTIVDGIRNKIGTSKVTYSANASTTTGTFDAIIAVVAENPYAEGTGDRTTNIDPNAADDNVLTFLNTVKTNFPGTPVVLVIMSGRPIHLRTANLKDTPDAIVAAWWPGSEGDGIADVLFGDRDFVGKTSYSWYENLANFTANNPLYPFGHGLRK